MNAPVTSFPHCHFPVILASVCAVLMLLPVTASMGRGAPSDRPAGEHRDIARPCIGDSCAAAPEIRVVAVALPLSGPHAAAGRSVGDVVGKALSAVAGIRVIQFDTAGTVAGAEKAVADSVHAGASLIVGGVGDREASALSAAAGKAGLPLVTMGRSPMPGVTTIQAVASRRAMNLALVDEMLKQGPVDCAWVIHMDNPFGEAEQAAFRWAAEWRGIRLAGSSRLHAAGADEVEYAAGVTGQIASQRDSGQCTNEILHLVMDVNEAGRLVDHLWFSGYFDKTAGTLRMTGTGLFNAPGLAAQHGSSLKGLVFVDIESGTETASARTNLFALEVEDFAAVAAAVAGVLVLTGPQAGALTPPDVAGRTGNLFFREGTMVGQRIRACRMTGRGLEFIQDPAAAAPSSGTPTPQAPAAAPSP